MLVSERSDSNVNRGVDRRDEDHRGAVEKIWQRIWELGGMRISGRERTEVTQILRRKGGI